jgi:hypothetical protein
VPLWFFTEIQKMMREVTPKSRPEGAAFKGAQAMPDNQKGEDGSPPDLATLLSFVGKLCRYLHTS